MVGGVWANYAQVSHSAFEFTIDFARLDFTRAKEGEIPGAVVARVNVSPLFVSQLLDALRENWERYAARAMPREVTDVGHDSDDEE
jgi:hypothetical protein